MNVSFQLVRTSERHARPSETLGALSTYAAGGAASSDRTVSETSAPFDIQ